MATTIKPILVIVAILILGAVYINITARPVAEHPYFEQFAEYPLVIAHAGSELYPTDTLYALEQYAAMEVDVLEMDVHMTLDGVIVLIHDDTVDRTTDGSGDVRQMTLVEVKALDAGYYWTEDEASYPFQGQGITIPTLAEVFEAFPGYAMIVEIKQEYPSMVEPFCNLIREYGMENHVLVPSFSDVAMQEFRQACPEVATAASSGEVRDFVIKNFLMVSGLINPEYYALQVPESRDGIPIVNEWFLWAAQRRGLEVHIWTINAPEDMKRFAEMGVDGIMTDRTDDLMRLLGR